MAMDERPVSFTAKPVLKTGLSKVLLLTSIWSDQTDELWATAR